MLHKKSDRPHHDIFYYMIYFIMPKQPTNLQANLRIVQLIILLCQNNQPTSKPTSVVGSIPAQTTWLFGFFFLFQRKSTCVLFRSQPVTIFSTGRSEKRKNQHSCLLGKPHTWSAFTFEQMLPQKVSWKIHYKNAQSIMSMSAYSKASCVELVHGLAH